MTYEFIWIILLSSYLFGITYILGKSIGFKGQMFIGNEYATWLLGIVTYFLITLLSFMPFAWLDFNQLYFIIIFIITNIILVFYMFSVKSVSEQISNINWMKVLYAVLGSTGIMFFYNFVVQTDYEENVIGENKFHNFEIIYEKMTSAIGAIFNFNISDTKRWVLGPISSIVIFTVMGSIVHVFSKRKNYIDELITLALSLISIVAFQFNANLSEKAGIYLAVFCIFIGLNILEFSRRRYGFFYAQTTIVAWLLNPLTILLILTISLSMSLIYALSKKSMSSLFWIQFWTPIILILLSFVAVYSPLLSVSLIIFIMVIYVYLISIKSYNWLIVSSEWLNRNSKIISFITIIFTFGLSIGIGILNNITISDVFASNHLVFEFPISNLGTLISEIVIFSGYVIIAMWIIYKLFRGKLKDIKTTHISLIFVFMILTAYNPAFEIVLLWIKNTDQFGPLKLAAIYTVPLLLIVNSRNKLKSIQ